LVQNKGDITKGYRLDPGWS